MSLDEFCVKLVESGSGRSRWGVCIMRGVCYARVGFRNGTVSSWFGSGRQLISE